jgi:hypothetical protein
MLGSSKEFGVACNAIRGRRLRAAPRGKLLDRMSQTASNCTSVVIVLLALAGCASPSKITTRGPSMPAAAGAATQANAQADAMRSWSAGRGSYLRRTWGVDVVGVRLVSSEWMLEFKFRVLDPEKAAPLLDEHTKPYIVDEASGARLAVPAMENVGELRQHTTPDANRTYFMIFGNADKIVPRGGRVSVVIGKFEATDLPVQ